MFGIFLKTIQFPVQWGVDHVAAITVRDTRAGWLTYPPMIWVHSQCVPVLLWIVFTHARTHRFNNRKFFESRVDCTCWALYDNYHQVWWVTTPWTDWRSTRSPWSGKTCWCLRHSTSCVETRLRRFVPVSTLDICKLTTCDIFPIFKYRRTSHYNGYFL